MSLIRTVRLGDWQFDISEQGSTLYISVPDCGGMADSVPRDAEQLTWAETAFAALPRLKRVWPTTWEVPAEALSELQELIERSGGQW